MLSVDDTSIGVLPDVLPSDDGGVEQPLPSVRADNERSSVPSLFVLPSCVGCTIILAARSATDGTCSERGFLGSFVTGPTTSTGTLGDAASALTWGVQEVTAISTPPPPEKGVGNAVGCGAMIGTCTSGDETARLLAVMEAVAVPVVVVAARNGEGRGVSMAGVIFSSCCMIC